MTDTGPPDEGSPQPVPAALAEGVRAWIAQDPDPTTREELSVLLENEETDELRDRFAGPLQFGTAGLRGALGGGPNRMNRVVVTRAAAGLARYLLTDDDAATVPAGVRPSVVIGYDARHRSEDFARDTAEVMQAAGVRARLLPGPLPTPVLAFAIGHVGCSAGVMVTASHNPPQDNGYKVYLGDGCQIAPPVDAQIAAEIDAVGPVDELRRDASYELLGDDVARAYVDAVAALPATGPRDVVCAYTPLHGVGAATVERTVTAAGFEAPRVVARQADPDPTFATVTFPNPEEPGAMDLALELGDEVGADVVVANDPDADRCAVGVPSADGWRMLSGDEVGVLLGDLLLRRGVEGTYATTIVSSSLLQRMAHAHRRRFETTLTGFKWIGRVCGLAYGYEEALGYAVAPHLVRDKDGISALVRVLELVAELKAQGRTLAERLDEIALEYGLHATDQLSLRVHDVALIGDAVGRLRDAPPAELGGLLVEQVQDLAAGADGLPPTDGVRLRLTDEARVVVRPSGTEPKLKCYLEVVADTGDGVDAARIAAAGRLDAIRADLVPALGLR